MTDRPHPINPTLTLRSDYRRLPTPVALEDVISSSESTVMPEEKDEYWREVEWMLRVTGGA